MVVRIAVRDIFTVTVEIHLQKHTLNCYQSGILARITPLLHKIQSLELERKFGGFVMIANMNGKQLVTKEVHQTEVVLYVQKEVMPFILMEEILLHHYSQ